MAKPKRAPSRLQEFASAIESMSLEAIPTFARIGQETGLGASLPEDTPSAARKPAARKRSKVTAAKKRVKPAKSRR